MWAAGSSLAPHPSSSRAPKESGQYDLLALGVREEGWTWAGVRVGRADIWLRWPVTQRQGLWHLRWQGRREGM